MPATGAPKTAGAKRKPGARRRPTAKPVPKANASFGARLIAGMEKLVVTLEAGGMTAVGKQFTVRRVKKAQFTKPQLGKADVVAIRASLGASQPVFASLLGVSPATVRAWEQGVNEPSGMATRFLVEIRSNPDYWKARLKEAAAV
jgi:DNA-binding transcriptional regulator YiaG